jgi:hypothetical protein
MALMKRRGRGMETSVMRLWSAGLTSHTQKQRNLSRRHIGSSKMITLNNQLEYLDEFKYSTKELYVEAYTSEFKHYGVTVTSRIEGGHSCLKKFLGTSNLFGVVKVISMLHTEQYDKIRDELAQSRDLIAHDINAKLPANTWMDPGINRTVVPLGLKKLRQQYELTLKPTFNQGCSGTFEKTMGIPCSHTIRHLIEVNLKVSAAHFNAFWLYDRPVPAPLVPDPLHDVPAQQIFRVLLLHRQPSLV